jgi:D-sedoheptulose 7-phosphate isomerase
MKMLSTPIAAESRARLHTHLIAGAEVRRRTAEHCLDQIEAAADLLCDALRGGGKILLCGNGGSAADCQHVAAELVWRLTSDFVRPGLAAIALTTDSSLLTAQANDQGFESIFERQVAALGRAGDVLVGITTSGTSRNVLRALEAARAIGMGTIVLTGASGAAAVRADVVVAIPSDNTQHIQETHLAVEHALCDMVERELFGKPDRAEGAA